MSAIKLDRASLRYGHVLGLSPTSFELADGSGITGLLGPNGAGKSTLIQMVSGLLPPTGGEVLVFGEAPFRNPNVLSRIGLVPEGDRFPTGISANRWLKMMGRLSGLNGQALKESVGRALEIVGMSSRAHLAFPAMSKGMRQRIRLAQAMLHSPDLLILDEPFNGLDSEARTDLMDLIRKLAKNGVNVLLSSHILGEMSRLTDRVLLFFRGRLLAEGNIVEIRELLDRHPVEVRVTAEDPKAVARWAVEQPNLSALKLEDGAAVLAVKNARIFFPKLQSAVAAGQLKIKAIDPLDINLDAVFQYLTQDNE
ncbi:MAG: ABC transporter ATP-binding protein [Holophagales bacterium]|jgi:ABC-2 type transport system ATP-binding protein|nr:ABC transporter ATP-binding protein [Holophagales bacterium]